MKELTIFSICFGNSFLITPERGKMTLQIVLCAVIPYDLTKYILPFLRILQPRNFRKIKVTCFLLLLVRTLEK